MNIITIIMYFLQAEFDVSDTGSINTLSLNDLNKNVYHKQSTIPNANIGLFAKKKFSTGDIICTLGGVLVHVDFIKLYYDYDSNFV